MPRKYQQFPFEDIGLGLDTYSPKDKIRPGALSDALNVDAEANSTISLRKGYERYYGNLPIRPSLAEITSVGDTKNLRLTFGSPSTVNLTLQGKGPIAINWSVYVDNTYTTYEYYREYYEFNLTRQFTYEAPNYKLEITNASSTFGYDDGDVIFLAFTKEGSEATSNYQISPELVKIVNAGTPSSDLLIETDSDPQETFVYAIPLNSVAASSKIIHPVSDKASETTGDYQGFVKVDVSVSSLSLLPPLVYVYETSGTDLIEVQPEDVEIDFSTETISVILDKNGESFTGKVIIISPEEDNVKEEASIQEGFNTIEIENVEDPFNFVYAWTTVDGKIVAAEVAYITYNASSQKLVVGYRVPNSLAEAVTVVRYPCVFAANFIDVEYPGDQLAVGTYTSPQITVWGFDQSSIYRNEGIQAAHVVHVDNYRAEEEERLISSNSGNLLSAISKNDTNLPATLLDARSRVLDTSEISPLFEGFKNIISITKDGSSAKVAVSSDDDLTSSIDAGYDYLVLQGCAYKANNGRYLITAVEFSDDTLTFTLDNPDAKDETNSGRVNKFSGPIDIADDQKFALGDFVSATSLSLNLEVVAIKVATSPNTPKIYVCGCTDPVQFPNGINLYLKRTSSILPLESAAGIVRGDMLNIYEAEASFARSFRVKQVANFDSGEVTLSITSEGDVHTASISVNSHNLNVGDKIFLYASNNPLVSGEHVITSTPDSDTLEFIVSSDSLENETAKILGHCVEIDEAITFSTGPNAVSVDVEGRWTIVESPINRQEGKEAKVATRFREQNFYSQPSVQSTVVNNSMFLSNSVDSVKKYDGKDVYAAGLPSFQPWAFLSVDTTNKSLLGGRAITYDKESVSYAGKYFILKNSLVDIGDKLQHDTTKDIYTVQDTLPIGTDLKVYVNETIKDLKSLVKISLDEGINYQEVLSNQQTFDFAEDKKIKVTPKTGSDATYDVEYTNYPEEYSYSFKRFFLEEETTGTAQRFEGDIVRGTDGVYTITLYVPNGFDTTSDAKHKVFFDVNTDIEVRASTTTTFSGDPITSGTAPIAYNGEVYFQVKDKGTGKSTTYKLDVEPSGSTDKQITSFKIGEHIGKIDANNNKIYVTVPYGTNPSSLIPTFIFKGSKVEVGDPAEIQVSGSNVQNFTNDVTYTVTDSSTGTTDYTVSVNVALIDFSLAAGSVLTKGAFSQTSASAAKIVCTAPFGQRNTDLTVIYTTDYEQGSLVKNSFYRYYARLNAKDRNNQTVSSAFFGADDMYADVFESGSVQLKMLTPPAFAELDYSRVELELYRTLENRVTGFRRVYKDLADFSENAGYILHLDNVVDDALALADEDKLQSVLTGGELGNRWSPPPKAKIVTTADNRLVLGNITSPPLLDVTFAKDPASKKGKAALITDLDGYTIEFTNESTLQTFKVQIVSDHDYVQELTNPTTGVNKVTFTVPTLPPLNDSWVYLFHSETGVNKNLRWSGWYKIKERTSNTITIYSSDNSENEGLVDVDRAIWGQSVGLNPQIFPLWLGEDGNFNQRREEDLAAVSRLASRLSVAVNAYMSSLKAEDDPPWLLARSGQSYANGNIVFEQADAPNGKISISHTIEENSDISVFNGNIPLAKDTKGYSEILRFTSRIALSYRNFPEIFDDPYKLEDTIGSIIDINPADGQEITAAVPFFGASAFGAAQLSQALVVFKTNSIYLVDIASNSVQKLQTQGQGCTAPKSVAVTKNGIFFANESGVYRLRTDMKITWMGQALDGIWKNDLEKASISVLAGHNYAQERRYKLSYPIRGDADNSRVAVYDSAREESDEAGSWTTYDNHPALGWCNQKANSFFASTLGRVYKVRNRGEASDYRDDDQGIPLSFTFGATDFGMPDERKITESVTVQFQNEFGAVSNVKVLTEQSISGIFNESGNVTVPDDLSLKKSGDEKKQNTTMRFSLPQRKGTHVRTRITKDGVKDEGFQISALTYGVRTTGSDGVPQSRKFRS